MKVSESALKIVSVSKRKWLRRLNQKVLEAGDTSYYCVLVAHAEKVLEERDRAVDWLKSPNRALGGKVPMELLDTDAGTEQVEEVLLRIDYGVYS